MADMTDYPMHSEMWWIRILEGVLTVEEARQWDVHRAQCLACQREWAALQRVEQWLLTAPEVPELSATFTAQTVQRATQSVRVQRWLVVIAETFVVGLVAWFVVGYLGLALVSVERVVNALLISWQPLVGSMLRTLAGLGMVWKTLLPLAVGGLIFSALLVMPNSLMATAALVWLSRRRGHGQMLAA